MGVINLGLLVDKIKRKLEKSGFVKNTDYASAGTGGVIKVSSALATGVTTGGGLQALTKTAVQYESAGDSMFIGKGTLDNLIAAGTLGGGLTQLYTAPEEPVTITNNLEFTLTDNAENYKAIVIVMMAGDFPVTIIGVPVALENTYFVGIYFDNGMSGKINYAIYTINENKFKRSFLIGESSNTVCKLLAVYGMN